MAEAEVAADEPETLILRFRDLVTAPGDTILRHAEKTGEAGGHVWWGWWAKSGEQVPAEAFGPLVKRARREGLPLFLFDSGRLLLFRAVCTDIEWDHAGDLIPSPDGAQTPAYYGDQKYRAWFKFSGITAEPVVPPEEVLHRHSYVQVDSFFSGGESRFTAFYGKRVSSLHELKDQERTIWFLRPVRDTDPTHEVLMVNGRGLNPRHFPEDFWQTRSTNLLWVSDPHFSEGGHHAFPRAGEGGEARFPLAERLERACRERHGVEDLGGVILSGDLTWRAARTEYDEAREFLSRTGSWAKLDNYQFAICPGNHDLPFSDQPWEPGAPVQRVLDEARAEYSRLYQEMFYLSANEFLSSGRRFLLGGAVPVEIVSLNTSFLAQKKGVFQGHGFVGEPQLDHAARAMGWDRGDGGPAPVRLLVIHHHLLPVTYRELPVVGWNYSVVLDAEAVTRWALEHRVTAVLHGHMHTPFHATVERPPAFAAAGEPRRLHVFGLGSAGVEQSHLGEIRENMFAVLRFARNEMTVAYYTVHPTEESRPLASYTVPYAD
jgi:hypothetical protein